MFNDLSHESIRPVDWNKIEDPVDKDAWDKLTTNFWLPEKVPLASDIPSWKTLTADEQETYLRVFAGLTLLDTVQGVVGAPSIMKHAMTPHEESVLCNISFMEAVHAKSYSSIFQTIATTPEINLAFSWSETNKHMQYKIRRIMEYYEGNEDIGKRAASVILESFLFFSGFFYAFHMAARGKMTNAATIISLILRDESVHGYYLGYKHQKYQDFLQLPQWKRDELEEEIYTLLEDLMDNELKFTHDLYDKLGLYSQVEAYLKWNANKALMNLGYAALYPKDESNPPSEILAYLDPTGNQNHDFFSDTGSSYVIVEGEDTSDDDWDF